MSNPQLKYVNTAANKRRVKSARQALKTVDANDTETRVVDLLANLMHLCLVGGIEFDDCVSSARIHFKAEAAGEW